MSASAPAPRASSPAPASHYTNQYDSDFEFDLSVLESVVLWNEPGERERADKEEDDADDDKNKHAKDLDPDTTDQPVALQSACALAPAKPPLRASPLPRHAFQPRAVAPFADLRTHWPSCATVTVPATWSTRPRRTFDVRFRACVLVLR